MRQLYQCYHAKANESSIYCAKRHEFGSLNIIRLMRGDRLEMSKCQQCPDYAGMGRAVAKEDRGWL